MNVLSLFDGMSCGQIALNKTGIKYDKYYASEIKENGIKVTQHNYPDTIQLGNVNNINGLDLPKIDLLIGGSPCQNLSKAMREKHRHGLKGSKSSLFFEYYRLYKETNPKYFLLENVGGMKKEDEEIITELLGVGPIKINSEIISPQLRNRLYWTNIPNMTQPDRVEYNLSEIVENGWTDRVKARCLLESDSRPQSKPVKLFHRYYAKGFTNIIFKNEEHYNGCVSNFKENFKGLSALEIDDKLLTGDINCDVYEGLRFLNQNELEKCQTVPSGYTKLLDRNESASLLGDGWTVAVIAHILSHIPTEMEATTDESKLDDFWTT